MDRKISVGIYASAFLMTVAVFAIAVLAAQALNLAAFLWVGSGVSDTSSKASSLNTLILMQENTTMLCPAYGQRMDEVSRELEVIGYELKYLGEQKQVSDPALSERYFSLEAESYGLSEKVKALCGDDSALVINFYSANCTSCGAQGTEILKARDAFVSRGGAAKLFSFDTGSTAAGPLAERLGVTSVPTVVINGQPHAGFLTSGQLLQLLGAQQ